MINFEDEQTAEAYQRYLDDAAYNTPPHQARTQASRNRLRFGWGLEQGRGTPPVRGRRHLLWDLLAIVVFFTGLTAYLWWAYAPMAALPGVVK